MLSILVIQTTEKRKTWGLRSILYDVIKRVGHNSNHLPASQPVLLNLLLNSPFVCAINFGIAMCPLQNKPNFPAAFMLGNPLRKMLEILKVCL